jgi:hypothetical protein
MKLFSELSSAINLKNRFLFSPAMASLKILCDLLGSDVEFSGQESNLESSCPHFSSLARCEKSSCGWPCVPATEYLEQKSSKLQQSKSTSYVCCPHGH